MKEKVKQWLQKIFQRKHNDAVIKDRVRPTHSQEPIDEPDYRFGDFRDEIKDVERMRNKT